MLDHLLVDKVRAAIRSLPSPAPCQTRRVLPNPHPSFFCLFLFIRNGSTSFLCAGHPTLRRVPSLPAPPPQGIKWTAHDTPVSAVAEDTGGGGYTHNSRGGGSVFFFLTIELYSVQTKLSSVFFSVNAFNLSSLSRHRALGRHAHPSCTHARKRHARKRHACRFARCPYVPCTASPSTRSIAAGWTWCCCTGSRTGGAAFFETSRSWAAQGARTWWTGEAGG